MADTAALQSAFEWVRGDLAGRFGQTFSKRSVTLNTGGQRTFNAVADDISVVATITNHSGLTSGGKKPVGKVRSAIADLYFLTLVQAPRRILVVTNPEFHAILTRELEGLLADGVEILHRPLPAPLAALVAKIKDDASGEMTR